MPSNMYARRSPVAVGHKVFVLRFPHFLAYDTIEDQWTTLVAPVRHCSRAPMVFKQGKIMVMGGYDDSYIPQGLIQTYDVHQQR